MIAEQSTPGEQRTPSNTDLAPEIEQGQAIRLDGADGNYTTRAYITVVGDHVLEIQSTDISTIQGDFAHYQCSSAFRSTVTSVAEAFEFYHGEYEPTVTNKCLSCGVTAESVETDCQCPVGTMTDDIEWPDIPSEVQSYQ